MEPDYLLMIALAVVGFIDVQLDRYTGRGLIARAEDGLTAFCSFVQRERGEQTKFIGLWKARR